LGQQGGIEMILQALVDYYKRKAEYDADSIAPEGFEYKEIPFVLVLDKEGDIVNLENTYEGAGKERRAKKFLVSKSVKRAVNVEANLLWDNPEYAFGIKVKSKDERIIKMHQSFVDKVNLLGEISDEGLKALKLFLSKPNKLELLRQKANNNVDFNESLTLLLEKGLNVTFKLNGEDKIISNSNPVQFEISAKSNIGDSNKSICLITGENDYTERLHPAIKGVWGCQSAGGNIVSFNLHAFRGYSKEQGFNAPCGKNAVAAYTTALNSLLDKDSSQRMQVGDASTVFWAASNSCKEFESNYSLLLLPSAKDNPDAGINAVKTLLNAVKDGISNIPDGDKAFYVLGLSPNAARISIRFFIKSTIAQMSLNMAQYFKDLEIVRPSFENEFLPLFKLLISTAAQGKSENINPHLAGDFMQAVLKALPLPKTLLQAVINRIKAEQAITYPRAALVKAYLNRDARYKKQKEEIKVSLNKDNTNQGYLLGRLFATLEKLQEDSADVKLNSTIMRYYATASSAPIAVFSTLMRLHTHHLNKLGKKNKGLSIDFLKLIAEITNKIDDKTGFQKYLSLEEQGMFSIGYYQQRQDLFTSKKEKETVNGK
jgi:CRISPR-associated protein Csd1